MSKIYLTIILIVLTINQSYSIRYLDDSNTTEPSNNTNPVDPSNNTNPVDPSNNTNPVFPSNNTTDDNNIINQNNTIPNITIDVTPTNYEDVLKYESYITTINVDERNNYTFWIKYKNSFSAKKNSIAKVNILNAVS